MNLSGDYVRGRNRRIFRTIGISQQSCATIPLSLSSRDQNVSCRKFVTSIQLRRLWNKPFHEVCFVFHGKIKSVSTLSALTRRSQFFDEVSAIIKDVSTEKGVSK